MRQPITIPILLDGAEMYQNIGAYPWEHNGRRFESPDGMVCDGASVPRLLWWFMPPDGLHRAAVLPHDQIFGNGRKIDGYRFTLWEADMIFLNRMRGAGVHPIRANFAWGGLRLGSWYPWIKCKNNKLCVLPVRNAAPASSLPKRSIFKPRHIYDSVF